MQLSDEKKPLAIKLDFAATIQAAQTVNKVTNLQLAKRLKVSQGRVAQMRSGKENFTIETMEKVAGVLGFDLTINWKKRK